MPPYIATSRSPCDSSLLSQSVKHWWSPWVLALAAWLSWAPVPADAQIDPYAGVNEVDRLLRASQEASSAKLALDSKDWAGARKYSTSSCNNGNALGCAVLGRLLAEPASGMLDMRAAETAHRKAADLYANACESNADRCEEAAVFFAKDAVSVVRNPEQGLRLFRRALDLRALSCERDAIDCAEAGTLFAAERPRSNMARAVQLWRRGCDGERKRENEDLLGSSRSCNLLLEQLLDGSPELRNYAEARKRLTDGNCKLAQPERAKRTTSRGDACTRLGVLLLDGLGGPPNLKLGEQLLGYACANEHQPACAQLQARKLFDDFKHATAVAELRSPDQALPLFETLCTANKAPACAEAGRVLRQRQSPQDKERGLTLVARACTLGNATGCYQQALGLRTLGGAANQASARSLLQKSCGLNDAPSCRVLGFMHGSGEGGSVDAKEAARLYELACNGRDGIGCQNLGIYFRNGTGVAADAARARTLYEKACELGAEAGCTSFGDALSRGFGGPADPQRGLQVSRQSCERNSGEACSHVAALLDAGTTVPADPVAARKLFEKACNLRHAAGCAGWSDSLLNSRGGPQNRNGAVQARRFACTTLNHQPACTWLTEGGHGDVVQEALMLVDSGRPVPAHMKPQLVSACDAGNANGCLALVGTLPQTYKSRGEMLRLLKRAGSLGRQDACPIARQLEGVPQGN